MKKEILLKILYDVKGQFLLDRRQNYLPYLCVYFRRACLKLSINKFDDFFNIEKVERICNELHIKKPKVNRAMYLGWWPDGEYKVRLAVINKLIKEAKESM